jgi:polyribonucleotide nucleotidyltransferase
MSVKRVKQQVGGRTIGLETGKLAKQANGAVVINCEDTIVLVTAVASPNLREGIDFFPLTVDIEERMYSVGKIPGGFFRREGRPTDKAILNCRLTDRPIRPSFPDWFRHEVQIIGMVLQTDQEHIYDTHCITGASAALMLSGVPFAGPISGVRMAHIRGRWVAFPTTSELENATIELIVAGRVGDSGVEIMMVEAGGFEHTMRLIREEGAPAPTEEVLAQGLEECKPIIEQLCAMQRELASQCVIPEREWIRAVDYGDDVYARVQALTEDRLRQALTVSGKAERNQAIDTLKAEVREQLEPEFEDREKEISAAFRSIQKRLIRTRILQEGKRIDDRGPADIRPLSAEVGLLSRAHGTGLFQRGETQALSVATLAMPRMEQFLDTIHPEDAKRFMHHYNFPPFSVGETGRMFANRRATGHGALAEKAMLAVVPGEDEFPYAIRVVSEVLESNGSTSMASTCASVLALMDAGVPLRDVVGGIAMGLIAEGDQFVTLTDILGAEDAYGDMDFKVAGTEEFITALQLDTKTTGISSEVLAQALAQAKDARLQILAAMKQAIATPRAEKSPYAPHIEVIQIPVDKIGEVIGPKGKNINDIVERSGAQIDIEDDGRVFVASTDGIETVEKAIKMVRDIVSPVQLEVGQEFDGTVVKTTDFGAFVNLAPGRDGLVHISKLRGKQRVEKVEDVVRVGDRLRVKIAEIRPDGKLSLVPTETGGPEGGNGQGATEGA